MAGYVDEFENLKKHDARVQALVRRLLRDLDATLERLVLDPESLAKSKKRLRKAYNKALADVNFIQEIEKSTVKTIVDSSYVRSTVEMPKATYTNRLLKQALIPGDSLTMSRRIRKNTKGIIQTQQKILFEGLEAGKDIVKLTREVRNADIFEEALPKYLDSLVKIKIDDKKVLKPRQIREAKRRISKIKNKGLKRDYDRLINALGVEGDVKKQVAAAVDSKTRSLSYRVTQNQTHATVARFKNDTAMKDKNTKLVRNQIYGEITCPYCLAIASLGWVPVENAVIPPHHPHCDCQAKYRKTAKKIEPWKKGEYEQQMAAAVKVENKKAEKAGRSKTYLEVAPAENLRAMSLTEQLQNTKDN